MASERPRALEAALGYVLFLSLGAGLLWAKTNPLTIHDLTKYYRLYLADIPREPFGELNAYVHDTCERETDCRCVVLVPGLGDVATTWEYVLMDSPKSGRQPKGYRVYAPNMPGVEGVPPPADPKDYGVRPQARLLRKIMSKKCPSWTVAGNSLGGWVSMWLALDWPEGVERLVLLAPAGLKDPTGQSEKSARELANPSTEVMKDHYQRARAKPHPLPERIFEQAAERLKRRPVRETLEAIADEDFLDDKLGKLTLPVSIIWGASDRIIPPGQGIRLRDRIKGSTLDILPDCGHLPQKECPAAVKKAIFGT